MRERELAVTGKFRFLTTRSQICSRVQNLEQTQLTLIFDYVKKHPNSSRHSVKPIRVIKQSWLDPFRHCAQVKQMEVWTVWARGEISQRWWSSLHLAPPTPFNNFVIANIDTSQPNNYPSLRPSGTLETLKLLYSVQWSRYVSFR